MPYKVVKQDSKWAIINKETGKVVGHSDTKAKAESSAKARMASHHGWKPTKRR